ncbi:tyrosinase family protein [Rhizobium leguminosarum]|uniref:tyrosinase family protein n=1 Tax=Rhizobium leguminosarum TaxID=384 RepID=UPI0009B8AE50|nr:tyrosinase family protein [Rhizobium leguminosarum]
MKRRLFLQTAGIAASAALGSNFALIEDLFAKAPSKVGTRKAAHTLKNSDPEVRLLGDAVAILKKNKGQGGWEFLATYHRDFCGAMESKEIHFGWYFLPWHRVYLAVMEQHLREAVKEPALCFPYWDWYAAPAIPEIFLGKGNPLSDPSRRPAGKAMGPGDLAVASEARLVNDDAFFNFGGGDPSAQGSGGLETGPHNGAHIFVGGKLGAFPTAALDPLFYAHHGNVDRMWEVWRSAGSGTPRNEPQEQKWDARSFVFLRPGGKEEKRTSRATISTIDLGYQYDNVKVKSAVVIAQDQPIAVPLEAGEQIAIELAADGKTEEFELSGAGTTLKALLPANDAIATALSSEPTANITQGRRLRVRFDRLSVPDDAVQIRVFLNPDGPIEQLHPSAASFAGAINLIPVGGTSKITASVDVTNAASNVDVPISEMPIVIVPYSRDGKPRSAPVAAGQITLTFD